MSPKELLQMFFDTGVLVGRTVGADGTPLFQNSQPVIPISNTAASELAMLYQDLINTIQMIERITGFNDATMGQAGQKTLVPGYQMAEISTNHALFPIKFAEKQITLGLAEDVLCRMAQGVKKGKVSGYAPYSGALNQNALHFIQISPNIALREYGIMLQERSTESERMWLMQQMQQDIANGHLDTGDAIQIIYTHNAKSAMVLLSYKVRKGKERAHQMKMQEIQANNEGASQAAQVAHQLEMERTQNVQQFEMAMKQMELDADIQKEQLRINAEMQLNMRKLELQYQMNAETNQTKIQEAVINKEGKVESAHVSAQGDIQKTHVAGEYSIEKQSEANKKPVPKSSNK
jgi:hypothetical protein